MTSKKNTAVKPEVERSSAVKVDIERRTRRLERGEIYIAGIIIGNARIAQDCIASHLLIFKLKAFRIFENGYLVDPK